MRTYRYAMCVVGPLDGAWFRRRQVRSSWSKDWTWGRVRQEIRLLRGQLALARHAATHDPLTGLANRAGLSEYIGQRGPAAIALLDLDAFKPINDCFGHQVGDAVLVEIARRLQRKLERQGCVARLGGDEFAIALGSAADLEQVLSEVAAVVAAPIAVDGHAVSVGVSVGVTELEGATGRDGLSAALHRADMAMYRAKGSRARVAIYDPDRDSSADTACGDIARVRDSRPASPLLRQVA